MTKNYEPSGIKFRVRDKEMMLVVADEPRKELHGWLLYRYPDGPWVTLRKATDADIAAISTAPSLRRMASDRGAR